MSEMNPNHASRPFPRLAGAVLFAAAIAAAPRAQLPVNFVEKAVASKAVFNEATSMAHADDGRIFVSERNGNIKVIKGDDAVLVHKVATTTDREQGLLKIQVHPGFAAKSFIYAFYLTADKNHHNITRIAIDKDNAVVKVDDIIRLPNLENEGRHNGGGIVFGKDGFLYVSRGNDELGGASNPAGLWTSQKGKVLRFTEDGLPAPGNPHYASGATAEEKSVWARGFRNPWTMSADPISGRILVGDVGDGTESIEDVTSPDPAKDYWYGYGVGGGDGVGTAGGKAIDPIYYHPTGGQGECAIVAEVPYNAAVASNWPAEYKNRIYTADYCGKTIRSVPLNNPAGSINMHTVGNGMVQFYQNSPTKVFLSLGMDGNLYYVSYGTAGKAMMIAYNGPVSTVDPAANSISVRNFVFRMGRSADVEFTVNGTLSLRDAGKAEFSVMGPDGKVRFRNSVHMRGNALRAEGFRPSAAGLYVCKLAWNGDGAERQAYGRLVVLP
ncbi:MAG: Carbohydrate binding family 6 [Fibrobacteres bacterium]|nr:Carbohydrate binding family 6 [Fibrobacterota bacterium]